jgi:hypothetical protein
MSPHHNYKQMMTPSFAPEYAKNSPIHQRSKKIEEKVETFFIKIINFLIRTGKK